MASQAGVLVKVGRCVEQGESGGDNGEVFEECPSKWQKHIPSSFRCCYTCMLLNSILMSNAILYRRSLENDVPTQRVWGVIKRRHLCKQFVRLPIILIVATELKNCLLLIFSQKVQHLKEEFSIEFDVKIDHSPVCTANVKLQPAAGWLSLAQRLDTASLALP